MIPPPVAARIAALELKWRKEADARDDGSDGRTLCSTMAWHLRWCADELAAILIEVEVSRETGADEKKTLTRVDTTEG